MDRARIDIARTPEDIAHVKALFLEYLAFIEDYLGQSLAFQNTEAEFTSFPNSYDVLLLAKVDGAPVAACGIKPFKDDICEFKRLYCRPSARGHNIGERLMAESFLAAKALSYAHMYLDTDKGLKHANHIYEKAGFRDIDRYYDNPMGCSRYMALTLM
ncbi:MAG: GNAT family N-acetyltransferase [Alphaproteobacteria bacterium]